MIDSSIIGHPLFLAAIILELILKAFALWRSGRNKQSVWFLVLYLFHTAGILPLIYLLAFQKNKKKPRYY